MSHSKTSAYQMYSSSGKKSSKHDDSYSDRREKSRDRKHHRDKHISSDSDDEVLKMSQPKSLLSMTFKEDEYTGNHRRTSSSKHKKHKSRSHRKKIDSSSSEDDSGEDVRSKGHGKKLRHHSDTDEDDGDLRHDSAEENGREKRSWRESSKPRSAVRPVVVDMAKKSYDRDEDYRSSNVDRKPKSLFDTYIPPPKMRPVSLLALPNDAVAITKPSHSYNSKESYNRQSYNSKESYNDRRRDGGNNNKRRNNNSDDEREYSSKRFQKEKDEGKRDNISISSHRITACSSSKHSFMVIPSSCATTGIHGRASFTVLLGSVKILGYQLERGRSYPIFSPLTGGLLSLHASGEKLSAHEVKEELSKHGFPDLDQSLDRLGDSSIAVLLVRRLESTLCNYITTFIPYTQLFAAVSQRDEYHGSARGVTLNKVGLKVAPHDEFGPTCVGTSPDHQEVLAKWSKMLEQPGDQPAVVLCCGAKNTGKSTFNRILINTALQSLPAVAYLECDVGQTEFSPPATVALHVLTEPLMGPPFCHQIPAERMVFYGEVMPGTDPSVYIQCLTHVYQAYTQLPTPVPLIVNTMGWVEGIGLMLLIDTIHLTRPDLVVQLESFNQAVNPPAITHETVALDPGWTVNKTPEAA